MLYEMDHKIIIVMTTNKEILDYRIKKSYVHCSTY